MVKDSGDAEAVVDGDWEGDAVVAGYDILEITCVSIDFVPYVVFGLGG